MGSVALLATFSRLWRIMVLSLNEKHWGHSNALEHEIVDYFIFRSKEGSLSLSEPWFSRSINLLQVGTLLSALRVTFPNQLANQSLLYFINICWPSLLLYIHIFPNLCQVQWWDWAPASPLGDWISNVLISNVLKWIIPDVVSLLYHVTRYLTIFHSRHLPTHISLHT